MENLTTTQQIKILELENTISKMKKEIAFLNRKIVMTSTGHFVEGIEKELFSSTFEIKD